jgi:hypothetical protein
MNNKHDIQLWDAWLLERTVVQFDHKKVFLRHQINSE